MRLSERHLDGPYISWLNDPEVTRFNRHGAVTYTRALAEDYLADVEASGDLVLAVHVKDDGRHIGNISLQDFDPSERSADFAILFGDRTAWGSGHATEAGRALVAHGFEALGLERITAGTMVENEAMRSLALRLGMREVGVLSGVMVKDGRSHDVVTFVVLRSDPGWR